MSRIALNETSYFDTGCRSIIVVEAAKRGFKKVFFVADENLIKFGVVVEIIRVLDDNHIPYKPYNDVKTNPTITNAQNGVAAYKVSGADFTVALGGGSSINTTKGVGITMNNPDLADVRSLEGVAGTKHKAAPTFALPIAAGTAAEVTTSYVIIDEDTCKRMVCVDSSDIPAVATIDPELTYSMSKGLTVATGMDTSAHAIGSYIIPSTWAMSDMSELRAIRMIVQNSKAAVDNGKDTVTHEVMPQVQYIAGMGFFNVDLGVVRSMAHPLSIFHDTPRGVANALLLLYVMKYNAESSIAPRYIHIVKAMGADADDMTETEGVKAAIGAVKAFSLSISIPQKLHEVGVKGEDIPALAVAAFDDICTGGNPRPASAVKIEVLYRETF